jgi:hypothetical protein
MLEKKLADARRGFMEIQDECCIACGLVNPRAKAYLKLLDSGEPADDPMRRIDRPGNDQLDAPDGGSN